MNILRMLWGPQNPSEGSRLCVSVWLTIAVTQRSVTMWSVSVYYIILILILIKHENELNMFILQNRGFPLYLERFCKWLPFVVAVSKERLFLTSDQSPKGDILS
jgi:hypothetical protein